MKNKTGRDVRNSRDPLHMALLDLVVEQPYESITVQQVLERAGVGRTTFYQHFSDKDDLLFSGMEPLRELLVNRLESRRTSKPSSVLEFASEFFAEGARVLLAYKALGRSSAGPAARSKLFHLLVDVFREGLRPQATQKGAAFVDAASHWLAGGMMGIVDLWTQQPVPVSGDDMNRVFLQLSRPAVDAIFGSTN